ncbi:MAG: hypothetical protein DLM58_17840 [Pseudonocardiales bacterium]|nr:MAG: hypothetical protein DLM58_17840 [Pseudonocardiales bacterium]
MLIVFERLVQRSDHLTIRLIRLRDGPLSGELQPVLDAFIPLGVYAEGAEQHKTVALDVASDVALGPIYELLQSGARDGRWDWEQGRVNSAWNAAKDQAP